MIGEHSKWNNAAFDNVILPEATIGHCRNHRRCRQFTVDLANGYCVKCWDMGRDTAAAKKEGLALKRAYSPVPNNGAVKKSRRRSIQVGGSTYMVG